MICHCDQCLYHRNQLARVLAWAHAWEMTLGPQITVMGRIPADVDAGLRAYLAEDDRQWNALMEQLRGLFHDLAPTA